MSGAGQFRTDAERLAGLRRMRTIATGLLVLMALLFVLARWFEPAATVWWHEPLQALRVFAEAAMIGALADWFAVTALFRRPFGLPIPHTDVIAINKDRIGANLGAFLEHNFVTREVINAELAGIDFADAIVAWLVDEQNRGGLSRRIAAAAPALFAAAESRTDLAVWLQTSLVSLPARMPMAPWLAGLGRILIEQQRHQPLYDRLLAVTSAGLLAYRPVLREKFAASSPRWVPEVVDELYFNRTIQGLLDVLADAAAPDSPWRERLTEYLQGALDELAHTPESGAQLETALSAILAHPVLTRELEAFIEGLRTALLDDTSSTSTRLAEKISLALNTCAAALRHDADLRHQMNHWMRTLMTDALVGQRRALSTLIEGVIGKWDGRMVASKLELQVGRDLQFIRINGTLVGGCVGLCLFYLGRLL